MIMPELFQGLGYWGFFSACAVSGLTILYPMANGMRNSSEYSVSLSGLVLIVSGIIAMFSGELRMGGWGLLVVASLFGWWILIGITVVVAASLDSRG